MHIMYMCIYIIMHIYLHMDKDWIEHSKRKIVNVQSDGKKVVLKIVLLFTQLKK